MGLELDPVLAQVQAEIIKAAETIATSTWDPASRSVFSPENLDYKAILCVPMGAPIRNRLPRVPGLGQATAWTKMTSKLHANVGTSGTNTSIFFADAAAPNETTQTYAVVSAAYKLLGRKLEVGGLANAASKGRPAMGGATMQTDREKIKMVELMLGEEEAIISGDTDNSAYEFDGILKQITTNSGTMTLLSTSGVQTHFKTIDDNGGVASAVVVNTVQPIHAANDLMTRGVNSPYVVQVNDQGGATGGVRLAKIVNSINGTLVDVLASRYVGACGMVLSEKDEAGEAMIEMEDLIPVSRIDVPSAYFSMVSFIVEATVLKVKNEIAQVQLAGLATS